MLEAKTVGMNQKDMTNFPRVLWRVITFPFVLLFNILSFPIRSLRRFYRFLNSEPEEQPLTDTVAGLISDEKIRQQLWDQIDVLRIHLLRAVIWLAIGTGISFAFTQQIIEFLAIPVGGLNQLKAIEVTEPISVYMRAALLSGIILSLPFVIFEFWWFAAPGLKPRERKFTLIGIPVAALLFIAGVTFTYFVLLPPALPFLLNFMGIQTELRPSSYFGFVTSLMFWIGLFFEFPLVIYILSSIGWVRPQILLQQWRLAIVIISIIAAVITPTIDPVNMGLVMLPMIFLYFVSIGLSYVAYAGRQRKAMSEVTDSGS